MRQSWSLGWGEMMHSLIMKAIRLKVDLKDEDNLNTFQSFKLFSADATKDIVAKNTEDDLLMVCQKGHDQLMQFLG